jgi:parallel beta-helix repeat protein
MREHHFKVGKGQHHASGRPGSKRVWVAVRVFVVALAVVVASPIASAGAGAQASVTCGSTITSDTKLASDLRCDGPGLVVLAAKLDLNGHSLRGSDSDIGVFLGGDSATVLNGSIRHFGTGVLIDMHSLDAHVRGVTIAQNTGPGLFLDVFAFQSVVESSTITHNGSHGIQTDDTGRTTVDSNAISHNGASGIYVGAHSDGGRYTNNRITGNGGYGIRADTSTSTAIDNTVSHNALDGIHFVETAGMVFAQAYLIASNRAEHNGGIGISACNFDVVIDPTNPCAPGMIDGGGNVANHNGGSVECENVVCARSPGLGRR